MDAASHRGIEEIRDIKEKINYIPVQSSKKIYIIDEVHMLTTEALVSDIPEEEKAPAMPGGGMPPGGGMY